MLAASILVLHFEAFSFSAGTAVFARGSLPLTRPLDQALTRRVSYIGQARRGLNTGT
jgi:hypothetical protein